jgi:CRISPR-associated protein Csy2
MTECPHFDHLVVLPRLRVQNANAVSSPMTHGFPPVTALLGHMWALERKATAAGLDLQFNAAGVICHGYQEQASTGGFVGRFHLTRNPVDKDGASAALVEEGRIHLDLSLVFGVQSKALLTASNGEERERIAAAVGALADQMRFAGGSVLPSTAPWRRRKPFVVAVTGTAEEREKEFKTIKLRCLPGFALVGRDDALQQRLKDLRATNPAATQLDALLALSRINWRAETSPATEGKATPVKWQHDRDGLGWLVPMSVGYAALGEVLPAGSVARTRDNTTPFRFVESLYSMGQWISPHRLHSPEQLLWWPDSRPDEGLYRCRNDYRPEPAPIFA